MDWYRPPFAPTNAHTPWLDGKWTGHPNRKHRAGFFARVGELLRCVEGVRARRTPG